MSASDNPDGLGNAAQVRAIAEQIAEAAVTKFALTHPELNKVKAEIPAPLKWAAVIISGLFTAGIAAMAFWVVSSINTMQVTLARMDERQSQLTADKDVWKSDIERRVSNLENELAKGR